MNGIETNGDFSCSSSESLSSPSTETFLCKPCKHLKKYKALKGFTSYKVLHAYYVVCTAKGSSKEKVQELECFTCRRLGSRIHACLHCVHFGCFLRCHIQKHAKDEHHYLSMDLLSGTIFCSECQDYKYDEDFDAISREQNELAGRMTGAMNFIPWEPSEEEILEMKQNNCMKLKNDSHIGLRGLLNLGLTCFMNCIVQVMVHTPLLRDYFLSDEHVCCVKKKYCEACLMCDFFQKFYSGHSTPFSIEPLLYAVWHNNKHLAGYSQNDAQELFSYILPAMHRCCQNQSHNKPSSTNRIETHEIDCNCVIHQIFSGVYQSYIRCPTCKNSTTNFSAFWDVNLDFGENLQETDELNLTDLIKRYTSKETIASNCDFCCSTERTIEGTLKKLPIVMCFHLKRLIQISASARLKIQNKVSFPEYLDVTPYKTEVDESDFVSGRNILTLFAVVCHGGDNVSGHYYSYVRQHGDSWYRCDDHSIEKVDINSVLDSEGYLLFYHKRILEYECTG